MLTWTLLQGLLELYFTRRLPTENRTGNMLSQRQHGVCVCQHAESVMSELSEYTQSITSILINTFTLRLDVTRSGITVLTLQHRIVQNGFV